MANKIDGGPPSEVDGGFLEDLSAAVGLGGDSETVEDAPVDAGTHDEDSWSVGDTVGEFWDDVKGTASEAKQAVDQRAQEAAADVVGALDSFDEAMHEIADVPDQIIEGGEELFEEFEQAKVSFAQGMDEVLGGHSLESVADATEDALDGAWNLTRDVAEAVDQAHTGGSLSDAVDVAIAGLDLVDEVQVDIRRKVMTLACDAAVEHGELIAGTAEFLEDTLGHEAFETIGPFLEITPISGSIESSRRAVLMLANVAKQSPEFAQELSENPAAMEAFINPNGVDRLSKKIAEVDPGEPPFVTGFDVEFSAHEGVGGSVSMSTHCEVARRDDGGLRVTIGAGAAGELGLGLGALNEGVEGDVGLGSSGEIVLDFHGDNAEEQVARLIAGSRGEPEEFLTLAGQFDAEIVESSGVFGVSLAVDADIPEVFSAGVAGGLDVAAKTIEGRSFVGGRGTFSLNAGIQSAYLQTPQEFAKAVDASTLSSGNPLVDEMIGAIPPELTEGVLKAYGPTAGLRLKGEHTAEIGVYEPVDGDGGKRLEFNGQSTLQAGKSTFSVGVSMTVTDLDGLAQALGSSPGALVEDLKGGQATPQMLAEALEARGEEVAQFLEVETPTVTMSALDGFDVSAVGQRFMEGRQRTGQVHPPPQGRTTAEQLVYLADKFSEPVEAPVQQRVFEVRPQTLGA
jgi:hypothetical protein